MKKSECMCALCINWVDCGWENGRPNGFCLMKDLFTYTCKLAKEGCADFYKDECIKLSDWEKENDPTLG